MNLKKNFIYPLVILLSVLLFFSNNVLAKKVYVTCDPPKGQRYDFEANDKEWKQIKDGFSGSHPTFFYDDSKPEELKTHWPAANPLGIDPKEIEKIVSGKSTEKILIATDDLIESYENNGTNSWISRLYPKKGIGIFLRHGYYLDETLYFGAVYRSNCDFKTIDSNNNSANLNNEEPNITEVIVDNYIKVLSSSNYIDDDDVSLCHFTTMVASTKVDGYEGGLFSTLDFKFGLSKTDKVFGQPSYIITAGGGVSNKKYSDTALDLLSNTFFLNINDGIFDFNKYAIEKNSIEDEKKYMPYFRTLAFNKDLTENIGIFGQAMNIALQLSSGISDIYINYVTPDPISINGKIKPKDLKILVFKVEIEEEKKEEISTCLMNAYLNGINFLTNLNANN